MKELLRTTDIVLLTYVNSLLNDACVPAIIADIHVSSVEGSIGAFPRRVLIAARGLGRKHIRPHGSRS